MFKGIEQKLIDRREVFKNQLGLKNDLALPRLVKVIVSVGVGKIKDKKRHELIADRLAKITGQKASARRAKKSIASFKSRQGEVIGFMVTLRGPRLRQFLDRLLQVAIPRIRDFRGFSAQSIDEMGNLTIGIKEHTVFPETADEELKDVFGLAITIVTTAPDRATAQVFFDAIDFPFRKGDQ